MSKASPANWCYVSGLCVIGAEARESTTEAITKARIKTFSDDGEIAYIDIFAKRKDLHEMMVVCQEGNVVLIRARLKNARNKKAIRVYLEYEDGEILAKLEEPERIDFEKTMKLIWDLDPIEVLGEDYGDEQ